MFNTVADRSPTKGNTEVKNNVTGIMDMIMVTRGEQNILAMTEKAENVRNVFKIIGVVTIWQAMDMAMMLKIFFKNLFFI